MTCLAGTHGHRRQSPPGGHAIACQRGSASNSSWQEMRGSKIPSHPNPSHVPPRPEGARRPPLATQLGLPGDRQAQLHRGRRAEPWPAAPGGAAPAPAGSWGGLTPPTQPRACWGHTAPMLLPAPQIPPRSPPMGKSPTGSACSGAERPQRGEGVRARGRQPPPRAPQSCQPRCLLVLAMENPTVPQRLYPWAAATSPPITACPHLANGTESPSGCFPAWQGRIRHTQHPAPGRGTEDMSCRAWGWDSGLIPMGFSCSAEPARTPKAPQLPQRSPFPLPSPTPVCTGDAPSHTCRAGYLPHRVGLRPLRLLLAV